MNIRSFNSTLKFESTDSFFDELICKRVLMLGPSSIFHSLLVSYLSPTVSMKIISDKNILYAHINDADIVFECSTISKQGERNRLESSWKRYLCRQNRGLRVFVFYTDYIVSIDNSHTVVIANPFTVTNNVSFNFTLRETLIAQRLSAGLLNKQIAHALSISEATVKSHLSAIYRKLGVRSRLEAAILLSKHNQFAF